MKRAIKILMAFAVIGIGVTAMTPDVYAQASDRAEKRKKEMEAWKKDMAEFRARTQHDRQLAELADSLSGIQAETAVLNRDFVFEADNVTFRNGMTAFVNSTTNFISVKGNRAVVQISPSNFSSGPNGLGGVTVDGSISGLKIMKDKKGRTTLSMNVTGIGINAQIEIYMVPGTNRATATVYPNFNSNTIWLDGNVVPYSNSSVIEGSSL